MNGREGEMNLCDNCARVTLQMRMFGHGGRKSMCAICASVNDYKEEQ